MPLHAAWSPQPDPPVEHEGPPAHQPRLTVDPPQTATARRHDVPGHRGAATPHARGDRFLIVSHTGFCQLVVGGVRQAMVPSQTPSGRPVRVHPTVVRTVGEVASLIARGQVVLPTPTSMRHRFGHDRIVFVPISDLPPVPLGLVWCTSHENERIRALARVAQNLS